MIRRLFLHPAEVIVLLFAIYLMLFRDLSSPWERAIESDGKGYYAYLTSTFIYHDHHYGFINDYESKYYPPDGSRYFDFRNDVEGGGKVNQYFPGVALLWLPFFLLAHFLSYLFGFETDGYSIIYQWSIVAAILFYLWLGLKSTHKLLLKITAPLPAASLLFALGFGTLLFCYTIYAPAFTHTYSFALIAALVYVSWNLFEAYSRKRVLLTVFLLCLIALVRPSNAVVILLLPFAAGSWSALRNFFITLSRDVKTILFSFLIVIILFSIPIWLWHEQTGHYIVYSYGPHKFHFSDPELFNNLFSYRKGLFLYTPLALVGLFGLIPLYKQNKWRFVFLSLFLLTAAYIISSWSWWWYGSSLGQRSYIDYYVVLALLLAWLYNAIRDKIFLKIIFFLLVPFFILLNIVNTYQHIYGINPSDDITKEIYWSNFLKIKRDFTARAPIDESTMQRKAIFYARMDPPSKISKEGAYGAVMEKRIAAYLSDSNMVLRIKASFYTEEDLENTVIVASFQTGEKSYSYHSWKVENFVKEGEWTYVEFSVECPKAQTADDTLNVYFWNGDSDEELVVDLLTIELFAPRK
jgi:hypothetical protein